MELKDALKITFDRKGREILSEPYVLKGYLMDIAPEQSKVISTLVQASASHIFDEAAVCDSKDLNRSLKRAFIKMYDSYAKKPSDAIRDALIGALDLDPSDFIQAAETGDIRKASLSGTKKQPGLYGAGSASLKTGNSGKESDFRSQKSLAGRHNKTSASVPAMLYAAGTVLYIIGVVILSAYWGGGITAISMQTWIRWCADFIVAALIFKEKHIAGVLLYIAVLLISYFLSALEGSLTGFELIVCLLYTAAGLCLFLLTVKSTDKWYLPFAIQGLCVLIQFINDINGGGWNAAEEMLFLIFIYCSDLCYLIFMYVYGKYLASR